MPTTDDIITDTLDVLASVRRGDRLETVRLGTARPVLDGNFYTLKVTVNHLHIEEGDQILIHLNDKRAKSDLRKRVKRQQAELLERLIAVSKVI